MKSFASFMKRIPSVRRLPKDVALVESINSLKETMVAEFAAVRSEFAAVRSEIAAVRSEVAAESAGLKKVILTVKTELGGLISNIAKSNEEEVGAAVCDYL